MKSPPQHRTYLLFPKLLDSKVSMEAMCQKIKIKIKHRKKFIVHSKFKVSFFFFFFQEQSSNRKDINIPACNIVSNRIKLYRMATVFSLYPIRLIHTIVYCSLPKSYLGLLDIFRSIKLQQHDLFLWNGLLTTQSALQYLPHTPHSS